MKWTNKHDLPDTILRAAHVQNARYDRGHVHRSVTQLIQPPRIDVLRKANFKEIEKDVSEEWWSLFGSAVHSILEMGAAPNQHVEQRMFCDIDGWELSGACDLLDFNHDGTLSLYDYKVTTSFVVTKDEDGAKPEWTQQLNMLAYMAGKTYQMPIKGIAVIAIVRDWARTQATIDPTYPQAPVVRINLPLWTPTKQGAFLRERVAEHRNAEMAFDLDQPLPECSDEERWVRENSWAVMREGGKKASKIFYNDAEAAFDAIERNKKLKKGEKPFASYFRPGKSVRCEGNYCQVAEWCSQYAAIKAKEQPTET